MTNMRDGMEQGELKCATLTAGSSEIAAYELSSGCVMDEHISGGQVIFTHLATNKIMVGSPSAGGCGIQAGQGTLGAGSNVWQTWATAFKSVPQVVIMGDDMSTEYIGSKIGTGSMYVEGKTASKTFSYIAVGSL